jgi:hypothetical protein
MARIGIKTNIIKAINAIDNKEVDPIIEYGDYIYYIDTRDKELGAVILTKFTKNGMQAIETTSVRYGNHHNMIQILFNPLPKKVSPPEHTVFPKFLSDEPMVDPTIILGFY